MATITVGDVQELVDAWREAARGMDRLPSAVDQQVGQATLRLAAASTVRQLSTRADGLAQATLQPARQWSADYVGGEMAESAVDQIDAKAKSAATATLSAVGTWAMTGNAAVFASGGIGIFVGFLLAVVDFGHDVTKGVLTGAIVIPGGVMLYLLRGLVWASNNAASAARTTWNEASTLGVAADKLMVPVVAVEARLWAAAGGAPRPVADFAAKARGRAQLLVGTAVAVAVAGLVLLAIGGYQAYNEVNAAQR